MSSEHLYIIGNGFDCYHGAKCYYSDFRKYLLRHRPEVLATFDLYFGPKSLYNSFDSIVELLRIHFEPSNITRVRLQNCRIEQAS